MNFHPLHRSPLPQVDEAPHEHFMVVAAECMAIKDNLSIAISNFNLFRPMQSERVQEDVKEHVKPFINYCCFKDEGRHLLGPWILVTKWTSHEGRLQWMKEPVAKYEGEVAMSSKAT